MQSTTKAIVAYAQLVHNTVFDPDSDILARPGVFGGQVRRMQRSYHKALVPFGELVMFIGVEKRKDKCETRNCVGMMLGLGNGTTERVVKARIVHNTIAGQRGDAAYAKSIRGVPRQPNPAGVAEGEPCVAQTRIVGLPMVALEKRPTVPVMEPEGLQGPSVLHPTRSGAREVRILR